jgi:hypothetical protein
VARAFDNKHRVAVILKFDKPGALIEERDIYRQLKGISGIPSIYGWWVTDPTVGYISMQPFDEDLYRYIVRNGPMGLSEACEVARTVVRLNFSPFVWSWLMNFRFTANYPFLRTREEGSSPRYQTV